MARFNLSNSSHARQNQAGTASLKPIYIANSLGLIGVFGFLYATIALVFILKQWNTYLTLLLLLVLSYDYLRIIYLHGTRRAKQTVIWIMPDCDRWRCGLFNGREYKCRLIRRYSYSSSLILILYLQHRHGGRYVIIPRDTLSTHNFRFIAYQLRSFNDEI